MRRSETRISSPLKPRNEKMLNQHNKQCRRLRKTHDWLASLWFLISEMLKDKFCPLRNLKYVWGKNKTVSSTPCQGLLGWRGIKQKKQKQQEKFSIGLKSFHYLIRRSELVVWKVVLWRNNIKPNSSSGVRTSWTSRTSRTSRTSQHTIEYC